MKTLLRANVPGLLALACAVTVFLAAALEEPGLALKPAVAVPAR